jgi:hypothetical protein
MKLKLVALRAGTEGRSCRIWLERYKIWRKRPGSAWSNFLKFNQKIEEIRLKLSKIWLNLSKFGKKNRGTNPSVALLACCPSLRSFRPSPSSRSPEPSPAVRPGVSRRLPGRPSPSRSLSSSTQPGRPSAPSPSARPILPYWSVRLWVHQSSPNLSLTSVLPF